jgi:lactate dehydrogenase-like 2-hydroxyacid dehydrogenase
MASTKPLALQMFPFSPEMEGQLSERLELTPWYRLDPAAQAALLAEQGGQVTTVLTAGHIGCPDALIQALPGLKLIAINGVGYDKVNLPLARSMGVAVSNTPDVLTDDVADLAVGLVIALKRQLLVADAHVRQDKWPQGEMPLARKVSGSRFGVFGLGRIGLAVATRLAPFGPVGYASRTDKPVAYTRHETLADLAAWSDVLVIACAASAETAGLVDAQVLRALGPDGVLVNISRGSVVDEAALIDALAQGSIAGAALDVFAAEPQVPDALKHMPNTVLTPHIASATVECRAAMAALVVANVDAVLAGQAPVTPVT